MKDFWRRASIGVQSKKKVHLRGKKKGVRGGKKVKGVTRPKQGLIHGKKDSGERQKKKHARASGKKTTLAKRNGKKGSGVPARLSGVQKNTIHKKEEKVGRSPPA